MGTEEDGQSNDNRKRNDATEKSKKGNTKRGTTIMIELNKKWDGNKIRVAYDEKGRPNNRVVRRKLAGMEGALARSKVPLSEFETWHDLPEPLRDDLWEAMQVEDGDTFSKMLPNLEISTPKVKDAIPKMKKTPTNHEFSTPKEEKHDLLGSEKARKDNKGKQIKDFGVVAKSKKALPNFEISTPQNGLAKCHRMTTYMKYLYGSFMSSQERYTFANPSNFTNYGNDDGEKNSAFVNTIRLCKARNQILLIPYNLGAIRAFTYAGGKRMMAGPNWQVVKEDRKKHKKAMPARKEDQKSFAATPYGFYSLDFMEPYIELYYQTAEVSPLSVLLIPHGSSRYRSPGNREAMQVLVEDQDKKVLEKNYMDEPRLPVDY
ncbi:hypothetical protein IFM89_024803 [Coptis chinensis]|uniref:Uncharacterized protein n=1 Tax=Coptis chinensis TaxID=261450 RepID=A0A835HNF0_9MAGN|nr:hypothetical protein IFM89_024803 [Coptis chinensis]